MRKAIADNIRNKKSHWLVLMGFWITLFFQDTVYKNILGIESLSRLMNILILVFFIIFLINALLRYKIKKNWMFFHVFPGLLVVIGMSTNIIMSAVSNPAILAQVGMLVPWLFFLAIPWLVKDNNINADSLWHYFYYFMLIVVILGIVEFFLIIGGMTELRVIQTGGGEFLAGRFSIVWSPDAESGERISARLYGAFQEPGTLAMFLLPATTYALFYRKYFAVAAFSLAIILTDSLGGFIGLAMLASVFFFMVANGLSLGKKIILLFLGLASFIAILSLAYEPLMNQYNDRGDSASSREQNFLQTIENLPVLITQNPLGLSRGESSEEVKAQRLYSGSNFAPGTALFRGGLLAFIGYTFILFSSAFFAFISFLFGHLSKQEKIISISLIILFPFILQRSTIWDSGLYAFLFAPYLLTGMLDKINLRPYKKNT